VENVDLVDIYIYIYIYHVTVILYLVTFVNVDLENPEGHILFLEDLHILI